MRTRNTVLFRLHMGPTMMLQQAERIQLHHKHKCLSKRAEEPNGPGSQFGASGDCEGEGKAFHSVSVCTKATTHGSHTILFHTILSEHFDDKNDMSYYDVQLL